MRVVDAHQRDEELGLGVLEVLVQDALHVLGRKFHLSTGGLRPAGPPYTVTRSRLRPLAPFPWLPRFATLARGCSVLFLFLPRGFAPPDPPTRSLARGFARSRRSRASLRYARSRVFVFLPRLRPPDPPTRSLARGFARSRRSRRPLPSASASRSLAGRSWSLFLFLPRLRPREDAFNDQRRLIRFAIKRYAPSVPAGSCRQRPRPMYTHRPLPTRASTSAPFLTPGLKGKGSLDCTRST